MKPISRGRSPSWATITFSWRATIRISTRSSRIPSQTSAREKISRSGRRTRFSARTRRACCGSSRFRPVLLRCLILPGLAVAPASFAVEPTPGVLAVASYTGADRTERVIAAAKREGELMLYSSLTQDDQLKLVAAFRRRYGVTVKFWRGSQAHILQRVITETRAGRFEFDVLETNAPQIEALAREKLLQKMASPYVEEVLLPGTVPAHGEWTPDRLNLIVYAYNTNAVKPADLPRAWADLLEPKWKRRIGMEATNVEWFAALVEAMGRKPGLEL